MKAAPLCVFFVAPLKMVYPVVAGKYGLLLFVKGNRTLELKKAE